MFYMTGRARELNRVLRVRVSEEMLADVVADAARQERSAGQIVRTAIRTHLAKGKRSQ